jgi:2-isopropylmalate synthase
MNKPLVAIYDTTLRDGTQAEGISFSKLDKLRLTQSLDSLGVAYIEGGWPGSNPRDVAFFAEARSLHLKHARLAAFGSTRRASNPVDQDDNVRKLLEAETPVVTIFGKSWLLHVTEVLRITPEQNLELIGDTCAYLAHHGREVIYDAEHFFDGYHDNPEYALATLQRAAGGGATTIVLCDTNGGTLPRQLERVCKVVRQALPSQIVLGIHPHNDGGCGVANALAAVDCGARHVQGTLNGIGERCGNVDLCSVIPSLELKMDYRALPAGHLKRLCEISQFVYDLANLRPDNKLPYVGKSAFAHKGGIHVNAVQKVAHSYEHIRPGLVGNQQRILVSDLSGGSNILMKAAEHNVDLDAKGPEVRQILSELKRLEHEGYEFEAADASFKLLLEKHLHPDRKPRFQLEGFRVIVERRGAGSPVVTEATVKLITPEHGTVHTVAEGDGPVHALDKALRQALKASFPEVQEVSLRDYKVRIIDGERGTAAKTRVLIESTDGKQFWGTVGVSDNIIEASWQALVDSVEYALYYREQPPAGK